MGSILTRWFSFGAKAANCLAGIGKAANDVILNIIIIIIIIIVVLSQKKETQVNGRNWGIFSMIKHSLWDRGH